MGDGCLYKCRCRSTPRKNHREHSKDKVGFVYRIEFYNKNSQLLSKFSRDMITFFGKKPIFNPRKFRVRISSDKQIFQHLINLAKFGSYNWEIPINNFNKETALEWLSAFIDCEGYIEYDIKNRHRRITITSVNYKGLTQIRQLLSKFFNVSSIVYGPYGNMYRLIISEKKNLRKLKLKLNHPEKSKKLKFIQKF